MPESMYAYYVDFGRFPTTMNELLHKGRGHKKRQQLKEDKRLEEKRLKYIKNIGKPNLLAIHGKTVSVDWSEYINAKTHVIATDIDYGSWPVTTQTILSLKNPSHHPNCSKYDP